MARHHSSPDSDSSDDEGAGAPETISLTQSKKDIQKLDAEVKKVQIAVRQSKRRRNREVDRKLKERANANRGGEDKEDELEARMQRATQEADEEMDEGESGSESGSDSENSGDDDDDDDDEDEQGSKQEEEEEEEEAEILFQKQRTYNANHLPDELFTAAFASKAPTPKRKTTEEDTSHPKTAKKRKRSHTQKDLIVGYAYLNCSI